MHQGRFRLAARKYFSERVVESPSMEAFKKHLDVVLKDMA